MSYLKFSSQTSEYKFKVDNGVKLYFQLKRVIIKAYRYIVPMNNTFIGF